MSQIFTNFHVLTDSLKPPPHPPKQPKFAKGDKSFSLRLTKFGKFMALYLGCGCMNFNFTTQMTLRHLLLTPTNKKLEFKDYQIYSKMFHQSRKNSSFDQCFLNVYTNSLVAISCSPLRTSLVSSATL